MYLQVYSWNHETQGAFPDGCGLVQGSAGEFYPPGMNKDFIQLFSNDLGRSIKLTFNKEVSVHGINSHEYRVDRKTFANGTDSPENACYEPQNVTLRSGVFNTSLVRFGAPVFISQPHFYQVRTGSSVIYSTHPVLGTLPVLKTPDVKKGG